MSVADYRALVLAKKPAAGKRRNKFGNKRGLVVSGETYDSAKESRHHQTLMLAMTAMDPRQRVVSIQRQVPFVLLEKQDGERGIKYIADFVVEYADGRTEVHDTKSPPTRADKAYVMKRKMMLKFHDIRIQEF